MTHEELLAKIDEMDGILLFPDGTFEGMGKGDKALLALRAVVELHKPNKENRCGICTQVVVNTFPDVHTDTVQHLYPCPTIQAIEKELA